MGPEPYRHLWGAAEETGNAPGGPNVTFPPPNVIIEGLAGMGKTRLLEEVEGMARRLSIGVGIGTTEPATTVVQLAPLMEALLGGATPIFDRRALDASVVSPEQRYFLLQDLEELLERAAVHAPIQSDLLPGRNAERASPRSATPIGADRTAPARHLAFVNLPLDRRASTHDKMADCGRRRLPPRDEGARQRRHQSGYRLAVPCGTRRAGRAASHQPPERRRSW
jgi:hypothetical protein